MPLVSSPPTWIAQLGKMTAGDELRGSDVLLDPVRGEAVGRRWHPVRPLVQPPNRGGGLMAWLYLIVAGRFEIGGPVGLNPPAARGSAWPATGDRRSAAHAFSWRG